MSTNTITLPGGFQLVIPALPAVPAIPAVPGLPANDPLLAAILPAISSANPQLALIVSLVSGLFQIAQAIHAQRASQPQGTNPSLDQIAHDFDAVVKNALQPFTPAATNPGNS